MSVNLKDLRDYVVVPALKEIGLYSKASMRLVIGTGIVESGFHHLHQVNGPALGFYQMEPATYHDIWGNYLLFKLPLAQKLNAFNLDYKDEKQLVWNLKYASAMCRIHYLRVKKPLPDNDDILGMAHYWKDYYNTRLGKGTVDDFLNKASVVLEL